MPNTVSKENGIVTCDNINEGTLRYISQHITEKKLCQNYGFEYLGEGDEGVAYGFQNFAIKVKKNNPQPLLFNDIEVYKKIANNIPLYPKMYAFKENHFVILERIKGKKLTQMGIRSLDELRFFPNSLKKQLIFGLEQSLALGIIPKDIHLNNIILSDDHKKITVIDVGAFHFVNKKYYDIMHEKFRKQDRLYQLIA